MQRECPFAGWRAHSEWRCADCAFTQLLCHSSCFPGNGEEESQETQSNSFISLLISPSFILYVKWYITSFSCWPTFHVYCSQVLSVQDYEEDGDRVEFVSPLRLCAVAGKMCEATKVSIPLRRLLYPMLIRCLVGSSSALFSLQVILAGAAVFPDGSCLVPSGGLSICLAASRHSVPVSSHMLYSTQHTTNQAVVDRQSILLRCMCWRPSTRSLRSSCLTLQPSILTSHLNCLSVWLVSSQVGQFHSIHSVCDLLCPWVLLSAVACPGCEWVLFALARFLHFFSLQAMCVCCIRPSMSSLRVWWPCTCPTLHPSCLLIYIDWLAIIIIRMMWLDVSNLLIKLSKMAKL